MDDAMRRSIRNTVERLAAMNKTDRRRTFDDLVTETFRLDGSDFARALDFNARLATVCRERELTLHG